MSLPVVAIVGRPNVGKSTLFNRLVGKKLALVDDTPGVTRDRRMGDARLGDLKFQIMDTAGLEDADPTSLAGRMRAMSEAAIRECDVVLFLIDARAGVLPLDEHFAEFIRKCERPVILVANKAEGKAGEGGLLDSYALGLGDPIALSAEHGEGTSDLYEALRDKLATVGKDMPDEEDAFDEAITGIDLDEEGNAIEDDPLRPLRVAIVGRPNAGKSTLINQLIGKERLLVGPEAGITRDSISVDWEWKGREIKLFDTAGMRRKARVQEKLEKLSVADGLRAVKFAEVVVVLLDATIPFEKQDLQITDLIIREGRSLVIGLNKWDLIEDRGAKFRELREEADRLLPQVKGVPLVTLSGLTGEGTSRLMDACLKAYDLWNIRISTGRLNRWFSGVIEHHPPPAVAGRRLKLRYITQAKARPPHFVVFCTRPDAVPESYRRYLINGLRETFEMPGVPIRLHMKSSGKNPFDKED
ncbi:GTP-binding protein EngA [Hartmannibacter diazotrophicus]|uniref:GTPase Der n=1 Tax=Hartmannibacter diazotrophicus TaxID=1482074 RepID=A0A2C9D856_9HYPH|nr:ribosome biogenesis GTPase Der [Hartmannibacter diazotrophicus]SON56360.1 GTP-binding protein EngA [Hartmannibacter diazotrophicus]